MVRCCYDLEHGLKEETFIPEGTLGIVTRVGLTVSGNGYEVYWQGVGKKIFMFDDQIEKLNTLTT